MFSLKSGLFRPRREKKGSKKKNER